MSTAELSIEQIITSFKKEGYVIIPNLIESSVVDGVRREMEQWVDKIANQQKAESKIKDLHTDAPFETRLHKIFMQCMQHAPTSIRSELHLPGMYPLFFHPKLLKIVQLLLGPEIRLYPNYTVRPKLPNHEGTKVLWHQDAAYTKTGAHGDDPNATDISVEALHMVNIWSPLVPARPENGCMQIVPGTHLLNIVPHENKKHYLEITEKALQPHIKNAIDAICDPGDVILFSNLLFHCGQPNISDTIRWSCDWRYQDATQSTKRDTKGHLAASQIHPEQVVRSADQWAKLSFG